MFVLQASQEMQSCSLGHIYGNIQEERQGRHQRDGRIQKGTPHKSYHGKTGRVYNVIQHAVGTATNKQALGRTAARRINACSEHMMLSKSRQLPEPGAGK